MSIARSAAAYINRYGFAIVRIPEGTKGPSHKNWNQPGGYWQDAESAETFLAKFPKLNIGAVLEPSDLVSMDVDDVEAAATVLADFGVDIFQLRDTCPTVQGNPARFRVMFKAPAEALTRHALSWPNQADPDGSKYKAATAQVAAAKANGDAQALAEGQALQDKFKRYTVFELRAGLVQDVMPPSIHPTTGQPYIWLTKPGQEFPELPAQLLNIWRQWDVFKRNAAALCPWAIEEAPRPQRAPVEFEGESVIDQFNAQADIGTTLEQFGYKRVGRRYLSPHSSSGLPGVNVFEKDNKCVIHHASDPLCSDETGQPVAPFDLYCYYEHGGDVSKAVKAAAQALGLPPKRREMPTPPVMRDMAPEPESLPMPQPEPEDYAGASEVDVEPPLETMKHPEADSSQEPFRILGYDRETFYFFQNRKQQMVAMTKGDFTETGMLSLAKLDWWCEYFPAKNGFAKAVAVDWIIDECYKAGIYDPTRVRGRGAWIDEDRIVFHFGSCLWLEGKLVAVTDIKSRYVYELDRTLAQPADTALTDAEGADLVEISKRFRWSKQASAALLAGFIALAPLCGALRWRPHIWITGGAGCGKTTVLNEYVHRLMGGMDLFAQGNSTEAGIRQTLRTDALPVLFDESEQNDEREMNRVQNVISLIRQASTESSAKTLKGTAGGSSMQFIVRSMFCLSSIQVGMKHQADLERLTVLALRPKRTDADAAGSWKTLQDQLYLLARDGDLPARLLRRSLELLPITLENIKTFVDAAARKFGSVREGDQYGTLLAGCWSLTSKRLATMAEATAMIESFEWDEYREGVEMEESTKALGALMEAQVQVNGGGRVTVFEVVRAAAGIQAAGLVMSKGDADAMLQRYGMRVVANELLISNASTAVPQLLRNTPYAADPRGQLLRVEGVYRYNKNVRFNGTQSKSIAIPLTLVLDEQEPPEREGPPL